ncbi:hypothetical protein ACS7SF_10625 [Ralstonia sp. 25C]|uniref:hypothetical protein n=1 Tax=Ralstonia sp. 25C TaxID=3447363 RepID=UPI003F74BE8B
MNETLAQGNSGFEINELSERAPVEQIAALRAFLDFHQQFGRETKALAVARALAQASLERLKNGHQIAKYNSANIADLVGQKVGPDGATAWLSKVWKGLEQTLEERRRGIQDVARQAGADIYAWPKKTPGAGGAGNSSEYSIEFLPLPQGEAPVVTPLPGEITYVQELTLKPAFWARPLFRKGFPLKGWRRTAFIAFGVAVLLAVGGVLLLTWIALNNPRVSSSAKDVAVWMLFAMMMSWIGYSILKPFSDLADLRLIMAPDVMVGFTELNVQLELARERPADEEPFRVMRLVRYSAKCAVCGETVHLADGKKEFPGRLIGRCSEQPREHVYSFDRHTRIGRPLR